MLVQKSMFGIRTRSYLYTCLSEHHTNVCNDTMELYTGVDEWIKVDVCFITIKVLDKTFGIDSNQPLPSTFSTVDATNRQHLVGIKPVVELKLTGHARVVSLNMSLLDLTVLNNKGITLAARSTEDCCTVEVEVQSFGESTVGVGKETDATLAVWIECLTPCLHHKSIIDGDDKHIAGIL